MSDRSSLEVEVPPEQWERFCAVVEISAGSWDAVEQGRAGRTVRATVADVAGGGVDQTCLAAKEDLRFLAQHGRHYAYDGGVSVNFDGEFVAFLDALDDDPVPAVRIRPNGEPDAAELRQARAYWAIVAKFNAAYPEDDRCPHGMFFTGAGACPQCGD